jgi:DNA-binding FadR family transcriptional regulator
VAIAEATGNTFFPRVMAAFGPDAIPRHKLAVAKLGQELTARERDLLAEHRAILAALLAGDPEAAAGAMRRHLDRALARYRLATTHPGRRS